MNRRPDRLIPLEEKIISVARRWPKFYGRQLVTAGEFSDVHNATLYRALHRLVEMGYFESEWEDPTVAVSEHRPRRRFYSLKEELQR